MRGGLAPAALRLTRAGTKDVESGNACGRAIEPSGEPRYSRAGFPAVRRGVTVRYDPLPVPLSRLPDPRRRLHRPGLRWHEVDRRQRLRVHAARPDLDQYPFQEPAAAAAGNRTARGGMAVGPGRVEHPHGARLARVRLPGRDPVADRPQEAAAHRLRPRLNILLAPA